MSLLFIEFSRVGGGVGEGGLSLIGIFLAVAVQPALRAVPVRHYFCAVEVIRVPVAVVLNVPAMTTPTLPMKVVAVS
jgi:hypothetical protein